MTTKPLKLYVWQGVLTDYTDGIMFALAESQEHARELISKKMGRRTDELDQDPEVFDSPAGFFLEGGG